jgi:hypothetical protein
MRHVEHPQIGYRVVGEVKYLLACWAPAADAIIGAILLAVVDRVDGGRRIGGTHPPAIHEVPRLESKTSDTGHSDPFQRKCVGVPSAPRVTATG